MTSPVSAQALKWLRRQPAVRRVAIPAFVAWRSLQHRPGPRRIVNSIPKAGTHLVNKALDLHPDTLFSGLHRVPDDFVPHLSSVAGEVGPPSERDLRRLIGSMASGQYMSWHMPYSDSAVAALAGSGARMVFVMRNPRDLIVSHVDYVMKRPDHFLHERYTSLPSDEHRLIATLTGLAPDEPVGGSARGRGLVPLRQRIESYFGWADTAHVTLRFEDLIGEVGGGTLGSQREALERLFGGLEMDTSASLIEAVADNLWSPASMTFTTGRTRRWEDRFTKDVVNRFDREMSGLDLGRFGYSEW